MNYANIKYCDIANGEGVRTSLFVCGCRRGCKGCFNPEQQSFSAGEPFTSAVEDEILESLKHSYVDGLTILGGEPLEPENQQALLPFVQRVKSAFPNKQIWVYTGFMFEELMDCAKACHTEVTAKLFGLIDVLVDGPFIESKHDITLKFRGSANQRIIDVAKTLAKGGEVVLWENV